MTFTIYSILIKTISSQIIKAQALKPNWTIHSRVVSTTTFLTNKTRQSNIYGIKWQAAEPNPENIYFLLIMLQSLWMCKCTHTSTYSYREEIRSMENPSLFWLYNLERFDHCKHREWEGERERAANTWDRISSSLISLCHLHYPVAAVNGVSISCTAWSMCSLVMKKRKFQAQTPAIQSKPTTTKMRFILSEISCYGELKSYIIPSSSNSSLLLCRLLHLVLNWRRG